jgi:hypothetical protein
LLPEWKISDRFMNLFSGGRQAEEKLNSET